MLVSLLSNAPITHARTVTLDRGYHLPETQLSYSEQYLRFAMQSKSFEMTCLMPNLECQTEVALYGDKWHEGLK